MPAKKKEQIQIQPLNVKTVELAIRGFDGPLVVHSWSIKAINEMLGKQMSNKVTKRATKDPEQAYRESLYYIGSPDDTPQRYGFPASGFKSAIVRAVKLMKDTSGLKLDMIAAKQLIFVMPDGIESRTIKVPLPDGGEFSNLLETEMVEIHGEPRRRMDMVRIANGSADVRFRGEFRDWTARLRIQYNCDVLDEAQIANLVYRAGMTVGIGEGRPSKGDQGWGRFEIYND